MSSSTTYTRKRHDDAQPFRFQAEYSDGTVPNFVGATLRFLMTKKGSSTPKVAAAAVITGTIFSYAPLPADVDTSGTYKVEWEVTYPGGKLETWPGSGWLTLTIVDDLG